MIQRSILWHCSSIANMDILGKEIGFQSRLVLLIVWENCGQKRRRRTIPVIIARKTVHTDVFAGTFRPLYIVHHNMLLYANQHIRPIIPIDRPLCLSMHVYDSRNKLCLSIVVLLLFIINYNLSKNLCLNIYIAIAVRLKKWITQFTPQLIDSFL